MTGDPDVELEVWDKTRTQRVWIGDPIRLTVTPRHNQQPTAALTLPIDHDRLDRVAARGARIVCRYRGEHLLSGPWRSRRVEGGPQDRRMILEFEDDWRLLHRVLAWQVPTAAITAQGSAEHHVVSGPAESVAKTILGAAITRLGLPITVAPTQGRGGTITVRARMDKPADVLLPLLDQAGIGLTVRQTGATWVLDAYTTTTWPGILSEAGGTITDLTWAEQAPTLTRVVLGADGEGTARNYRSTVASARESEWGDVIEGFIDARDLKSTDAGFAAAAAARMTEALADGAPTTGFTVSLTEAGRFQYGGVHGVRVGDVVPVELAPGVAPISDVLRAATLTWDRAGVRVTPVIGERRDDPTTATARAIAAAHRGLRALQTRR